MDRNKIKLELLIHDLKVPLAVVSAGIQSLLERRDKYGALTPLQEKVLQRILRNTLSTQRQVNEALEIGRSEDGVLNFSDFVMRDFIKEVLIEIFDLTDAPTADNIKTCVSLSELKQNLTNSAFHLHIEDNLWDREFCLDNNKLKHILRNLLDNAFKYRRRKIDLKIEIENAFLIFSVSDDGDGISEEFHKKIFDSYFQVDITENHPVRGHGLGLAGVMVLVENLGGKLVLESDIGKGATFRVHLPMETSISF